MNIIKTWISRCHYRKFLRDALNYSEVIVSKASINKSVELIQELQIVIDSYAHHHAADKFYFTCIAKLDEMKNTVHYGER
jgi:hypothetical protein